MNMFIWFGIVFCLTQSAMFSGLNLAFFSLSQLRLEVEGMGAINFLSADDLPVHKVGSPIDEKSIIMRTSRDGDISSEDYEAFVAEVNNSDRKWMVIENDAKVPALILDADAFCRAVVSKSERVDPRFFCMKPLVIRNADYTPGQVLVDLKNAPVEVTKEIVLV